MIGEFRSSLYDLFGYLLPGIVAAVALLFLVWPFLDAVASVALPTLIAGRLVWVFLVGSYFLGHLLHAAGNYTPGLKDFEKKVLAPEARTVDSRGPVRRWLAKRLRVTPLSDGLRTRINRSVRDYMPVVKEVEEVTRSERSEETEHSERTEEDERDGLITETRQSKEIRQSSHVKQTTHTKETSAAADLAPAEIYQLMDEARVFLQREGDREVYVYREGFYRGSAYAFGLLLVAGLTRAILAPTAFLWGPGTSISVTRSDAILVAGVAFLLGVSSVLRTRRFGETRVKRAAMLWFAVLAHLRGKK